jgi:CHAT domain-containing protein
MRFSGRSRSAHACRGCRVAALLLSGAWHRKRDPAMASFFDRLFRWDRVTRDVPAPAALHDTLAQSSVADVGDELQSSPATTATSEDAVIDPAATAGAPDAWWDADPKEVARALTAYVNTRPWKAKWPILEREQALLLTNTALAQLKEQREALSLTASETQSGTGGKEYDQAQQTQRDMVLLQHSWILWRARQIDATAAVAEFEALQLAAERAVEDGLADTPLARTALAWLNTPTRREGRRFLEKHLELLGQETEHLLQVRIFHYLGQHTIENSNRRALAILQDARELGGDIQAIQAAYVNAYGGFTLDLPEWVMERIRQLGDLQRSGRADQTAARRMTLLFETLARAVQDPAVLRPSLAAIHTLLASALREDPRANRQRALEDALAEQQAAIMIYTLERFPYRYATTQNDLAITYRNRIAGNRRENLEESIQRYQEALRVRTLADFPVEHRDTSINLAWLAFETLVKEAEERGSYDDMRQAFELADRAFTQARAAQTELGWHEGDVQGRAQLRGEWHGLRELYARHAYTLWRLGRVQEAVAALEAGRVQALADAQALSRVSFEGIDPADAVAFQQAQRDEEAARTRGDLAGVRRSREALIAARDRIRSNGHSEFLPGEPDYAEVVRALVPGQAALYLSATKKGGLAFLALPATTGETQPDPLILELPTLTWDKVDRWLVRPNTEGSIVGGFQHALDRHILPLLVAWLQRQEEAERIRLLALPLQALADSLPGSHATVRTSLSRMITSWETEAAQLATGDEPECETALLLHTRLQMSLEEALNAPTVFRDLSWFFMEAELETLLPELTTSIMQPLRAWLDEKGFSSPDQQIALIAGGRLGALPLHAALVHDVHGQELPFQETCELTYQASVRILALANDRVKDMPAQGSWFTVGNPQPTRHPPLEWAEAEAEAVVDLALMAGRADSKALLAYDATDAAVVAMLRAIRSGSLGAWVDIATHGHADPGNLGNCYLLLGGFDANGDQETLSLTELQRSRLLEGTRCFNASGCTTALGDLDVAPDELSSLPAGVLQSGAASAIATQWSVDDRATFLLMLRFAQVALGQPGITPARALREASAWLRQATWEEIEQIASKGMRKLRPIRPSKRSDRAMIRGIADATRDTRISAEEGLEILADMASMTPSGLGRERPFAHPIYWAAAIVYGA